MNATTPRPHRDWVLGIPLRSLVDPSLPAHAQLWRHSPCRWGDEEQQDAQEFLHAFLEALQQEMNRVRGKPAYKELSGKGSEAEQAAEAAGYARSWHDSLIDDVFGGLLQSCVTCHSCGTTYHCFDPFLDLCVPINGAKGRQLPRPGGRTEAYSSNSDSSSSCSSEGRAARAYGAVYGYGAAQSSSCSVQSCLASFVEPEVLDGEEKYSCAKCKSAQPATKQLQIYHYPKVLVLALKRFANDGCSSYSSRGFLSSRFGGSTRKNSTAVQLEVDHLDLSSYCNVQGMQQSWRKHQALPVYELVAMSNHSGSLYGGHYTAQARLPGSTSWFNFDDTHVSRESAPTGASSNAYVLFYRLKELPE